MEKAIKIAIENGYKFGFFAGEAVQKFPNGTYAPAMFSKELLDPLFWQALGKGLGWKQFGKHNMKGNNLRCSDCGEKPHIGDERCVKNWKGDWQYHWHRFIDHLAEGKDINSFFEELLA